ncbi:MAG: SAM-dependent methyltransferase [Micromonosporaceae bacterium]|nr:SAM-dependent methyltransferase [Micromonosporaceae bacterium]
MLLAPSANRVYADAAARLTRAELAAFGEAVLDGRLAEIEETEIAGVGYVTFTGELSGQDLAYLANLSAGYALFELADGPLLRPVRLRPLACFDDDLITIPKYAGKTNEQFTKLLLNVTLLASGSARSMVGTRLTVLDPLCGRGTTLNQALMYGYHAIGIEVNGKDVDAYAAFLRTWLRRKRLKHSTDLHPVRRDRRLVARCFEAAVGDRRAGEQQRVTVYHADTTRARDFLRAGCADVVVADAPYGVAHGSRTPDSGLSRRPLDLLRSAVPVWAQLLRPGGAAGIAWNTHVAGRDELAKILLDAGLTVVDTPAYRGFGHWVDQAVNRDILVARKP